MFTSHFNIILPIYQDMFVAYFIKMIISLILNVKVRGRQRVKYTVIGMHTIFNFFWTGYFIVALTARSYRDCHFFCLGMVLFIDILNLSSHTWDFSLSMADIYRAMSKVVSGRRPTWSTMSSDNPTYHERHLSGRVQSSLRVTSDVWTIMI